MLLSCFYEQNQARQCYWVLYFIAALAISSSRCIGKQEDIHSVRQTENRRSLKISEIGTKRSKKWERTSTLQFLHFPKTGGTAIETAAFDDRILWGFPRFLNYCKPPLDTADWHYPLQFLPYANLPCRKPVYDKNATFFLVVRNPYDRVISEYYYYQHFNQRESHMEVNHPKYMNEWILQSIRSFQQEEGEQNGYFQHDGHWIPQYDFVFAAEKDNNNHSLLPPKTRRQQLVNHILRYENLQEEFRSLMILHDLNVTLPAKRDSMEHNFTKSLTRRHLYRHTCHVIEDTFKDDFAEFGYDAVSCGGGGGRNSSTATVLQVAFKILHQRLVLFRLE